MGRDVTPPSKHQNTIFKVFQLKTGYWVSGLVKKLPLKPNDERTDLDGKVPLATVILPSRCRVRRVGSPRCRRRTTSPPSQGRHLMPRHPILSFQFFGPPHQFKKLVRGVVSKVLNRNRNISTSQLNALLRLHLKPINLVISYGSLTQP